jgi:hypothetical protein
VKYAFVSTNVLDLLAEPRFLSERLSQLLFAEVVKVANEKDGYGRVSQEDGYVGWADSRHLTPLSRVSAQTYMRSRRSIVTATQVPLYSELMKPTPPYCLFYGTRLVVRPHGNALGTVLLPDKNRFLVKVRNLRPIGKARTVVPTGAGIIAEALRFLGVPYLWGGVTACGFDCSGLVRAVYGRFGIYLPRDTKDQISVGIEVPRGELKTGDLVFFERHVGLAIGRSALIHASLGGSGVRINSLTAGGADYRADLDRTFRTARRIL